MDVRVAFDYVKACLADPTINKVVLIGHSQGGIIASLVLDQLFADLPSQTISKIVSLVPNQSGSIEAYCIRKEVYTFGNAASHFNNPLVSLQPRDSLSKSVHLLGTYSERCIPHIEHYVNELDMIPRWGVLYNVMEVLDNCYSGKVFVRMGATGHMFVQHYMDYMFPLDPDRRHGFLDKVVDVDEVTASRRENEAIQQVSLMKRESTIAVENIEFGDGQKVPVEAILEEESKLETLTRPAINIILPRNEVAQEARGKSVKQLSRLWRYVDGGSPADFPNEVEQNWRDEISPAA
ncbi:hypothetical protein MMC09_003343 [Bachmanniomyces sp. S44760]|nr:hypothetical protein [Bachmanniomyces sp. S44760]